MNWDGYEPYRPESFGLLKEMPRAQARREYDLVMESVPARLAALDLLLRANGLALEDGDEGLQRLNDWFIGNVAGDQTSGRLDNLWYAVVHDIGLHVGEVMIKRWPSLHWAFFTHGKRDVAYQRHVIVGFTKVVNPDYYIETALTLGGYGGQVVHGYPVDPNKFVKLLERAGSLA